MILDWIILQITQAPDISAAAGTDAVKSLSLLDLIKKGGFIMIPIGILSIASVYLFIERYSYIKKASTVDPHFVNSINEMLEKGNVNGAQTLCKSSKYPLARVLERGLNRIGSPIHDIERSMENVVNVEVGQMEKYLNILAAIAAIAPMFGFLGTVFGMITTFYNISQTANISIDTIAGGIYQKMVSSAAGLVVGIIAHMFFTYLNSMIDRFVNSIEVTAIDFMDVLHKPAKL